MVYANRTHAPRRTRTVRGAVVVGLVLASTACQGLLDVPEPDAATEESLLRESALPVLFAGAIRDFQLAYTGFPSSSFDEGFVLVTGLMADEYDWGDSFDTRREIDARNVTQDNLTAGGVYAKLQRARVAVERADNAFAELAPDDARRAELANLTGLLYVFFAEMYCSGVPFSDPTSTPWVFGDPMTTTAIYQLAVQRFDAALGVSSATDAHRNLARLGKARALLDLNEPVQAAAEAALVPTSFRYELQHSDNTSTQNNGIWAALNNVKRYRVADQDGGNGLPYRGADDPRVLWFTNGSAFDTELQAYSQLKYPDRPSSAYPAEGIEARLIEAEAALRDDDLETFVGMHNLLRATVPGLGTLAILEVQQMSQAERVDLHFQERGFWLWQTGHRFGDLRRLVRQYGRSAEQVFPTGDYFKGGTYGTDVNFPVPVEELNNPKFSGCLDRAA